MVTGAAVKPSRRIHRGMGWAVNYESKVLIQHRRVIVMGPASCPAMKLFDG